MAGMMLAGLVSLPAVGQVYRQGASGVPGIRRGVLICCRETLMGKYGEDSKLIYDLADQGGELLSLR